MGGTRRNLPPCSVAGGTFLVIVAIFWAVEQRRAAKAHKKAVAESEAQTREWMGLQRESMELQRESNRLLALIAEKMERG